MTDEALIRRIRRADAFTNAATVLVDASERSEASDSSEERGDATGRAPEVWEDIREHVIPALETEADRATEEVERLRGS